MQDELTGLAEPVPVKMRLLQEKAVSGQTIDGEITAVSVSQIEVRTPSALHPYDNLLIDAGFELYAKVVRESEEYYTLAFTAKGDGFDEWMRALGERR